MQMSDYQPVHARHIVVRWTTSLPTCKANLLERPPSRPRPRATTCPSRLRSSTKTTVSWTKVGCTRQQRQRTRRRQDGSNTHGSYLTGLNILLACFSFYTIMFPERCSSQVQGWDTELADARGAIEYETRSYTGALTYSHEKKRVTRLHDGEMEFFGPPSASIDESWEYLLNGM